MANDDAAVSPSPSLSLSTGPPTTNLINITSNTTSPSHSYSVPSQYPSHYPSHHPPSSPTNTVSPPPTNKHTSTRVVFGFFILHPIDHPMSTVANNVYFSFETALNTIFQVETSVGWGTTTPLPPPVATPVRYTACEDAFGKIVPSNNYRKCLLIHTAVNVLHGPTITSEVAKSIMYKYTTLILQHVEYNATYITPVQRPTPYVFDMVGAKDSSLDELSKTTQLEQAFENATERFLNEIFNERNHPAEVDSVFILDANETTVDNKQKDDDRVEDAQRRMLTRNYRRRQDSLNPGHVHSHNNEGFAVLPPSNHRSDKGTLRVILNITIEYYVPPYLARFGDHMSNIPGDDNAARYLSEIGNLSDTFSNVSQIMVREVPVYYPPYPNPDGNTHAENWTGVYVLAGLVGCMILTLCFLAVQSKREELKLRKVAPIDSVNYPVEI